MSNPTTGTTAPIHIPRESPPKVIQPGESYFFIKIRGAQAAFAGSFWERAQRLIVTTQVSLNHPVLGPEPMRAIQRSRSVQRGHAEQLGLSPNLINLVPATMTHVSTVIEFVLDTKNRLADLGGLINDDAFVAAVSLAPGGAVAARTIGGIAQKLIQTFLSPEERQPILQFGGDFDIAGGDLKDGFYVILGTRDEQSPLPNPLPPLEVRGGELLAEGKRVVQHSYVILDVRCVEARTRALNEGAPWEAKLRQAEAMAQRIAGDPFADDETKHQAWSECRDALKEAQLLLIADPNYLEREATAIIGASLTQCHNLVFGDAVTRSAGQSTTVSVDLQPDLTFLNLPVASDLQAMLNTYADQVGATRQLIRAGELG